MMLNWMTPFFGTDLFIPHGHCYLWKPELVWLHILSDLLISLAYYSIPLTLFYFVRRRRDLPFTWVFLLFSAFIVACGTTHLMEIWTLWHPTYWLSGAIKLMAAVISLTTAVLLVTIVPKALALPNNLAQLEAANQALRESENRFQTFMDNSPAAAWITDAAGRFLYLSQAYSQLFQVPNEAIGKTIFELFAPEMADQFHGNIQQVIETNQTLEAIEVAPRPSGTLGEFLVYRFPIRELSGQCVVGGVAVDVTERQQTKKQLRSLNNHLQYLLTNAPVVIFSYKADGDYGATWVSENVRTLLGYEPREFLEESGFWANHLHPEDRDQIFANVSQIFTTGHHVHEYRFMHGDGDYRWVYQQLQLMRDEVGNPTEMIGYLVDISDRKQAEEALRRYERIVSASTDAILLIDRNYVFQIVNQAYLNWYDKQPDEVVGHTVSDIMSQEMFQNTLKPQLDQCLAGQVAQSEMWVDYPTIGTQFFSITYEPYFDISQTPSGVVVSLRNITRLKQIEIEIELQSIIVKNMAEGVCMVKVADETIFYANPKFERIFGYDAGELKGKHVSILNYQDEVTDPKAVHQEIATAILQEGEATYEVHNVKKDGTPFWCQATTSLFDHPDYGIVLVAVQQDITERQQAESLIQASLKEKEALLKEIHHRVKNNLGVVDGLLQMQSRRSANPQVVETLKESQNRITSIALVHEKLYGSEDLANIDFAQYISDLTAHLFDSYNIQSSQIKLTIQIDRIPLDIDTAIPCGLIINELVSNALKYAFSDIQTGEIQVTLHQHQDQSLFLIVRDNGIGLPQDFNLNQTKTLGMNLVKGLVKQLKGTLEVCTQQGTTFLISLNKT